MAAHTCTFKAVSGSALQVDLDLPAGGGPHAAILWLHGGALIFGQRSNLAEWQRQAYLDAGLAVAAADYRLAPETPLPGILEDVRAAYEWLRATGAARWNIDAQRIGIVGHSAGGYLTLMSGLLPAPRPRALVAFYGYGDIGADWYARPDPFYCQQPLISEQEAFSAVDEPGSEPPPVSSSFEDGRFRFYLYCRQQGLWPRQVTGHDALNEPQALAPYCPVLHVDGDYPPTLLLHGTADTDVPYAQSVHMAQALARAGVEHELYTVSDGGHGFDHLGPQDSAAHNAVEHAIAFLRRYL